MLLLPYNTKTTCNQAAVTSYGSTGFDSCTAPHHGDAPAAHEHHGVVAVGDGDVEAHARGGHANVQQLHGGVHGRRARDAERACVAGDDADGVLPGQLRRVVAVTSCICEKQRLETSFSRDRFEG
jgi:hypothetical protein